MNPYVNGVLEEGHGELVLSQEDLEGVVDLGGKVLPEVLEGLLADDTGISEPLAVRSDTTGLDNLGLEGGGLDDLALGVADSTTTLEELDLFGGLCVTVEVLSLDLDVSEAV